MHLNPQVSIVIPVFDEEGSVPTLVARTVAAARKVGDTFEVILVDDGSNDNSPQLLREAAAEHPQVVCLFFNRNYGQHSAVMAGLAASRGEAVITLDADLQNPPEEIPRLVETLREGFDVVGTVRVPRNDSLFRRFSSYLTNLAVQKSTGVLMHDYGCMLRAYRRPVVDAMLQCRESSTFIPVLANSFAHRTTEIEVAHEQRHVGSSKYSLWKLVRLQLDLVTSMTTFPIRALTGLGVVLAVGGFAAGLLILVLRLFFGAAWAAQGVFTLFAALYMFIGAQFVGMGMLGEYIGRIYVDVRARPRYLVSETLRSGEPSDPDGSKARREGTPPGREAEASVRSKS